MLLSSVVNKEAARQYHYAKMLSGSTPVFSQFGQDVYASDVVQICIDKTAAEISKLTPKHIRVDKNNKQTIPNSPLNRLFEYGPNELMTTRDFLEKIIWLLFLKYNCFIYPRYTAIQERGGWTREYTGFYPLNPTQVTFMQDTTDRLFVELQFGNGQKFILGYGDIIHLRKKFSVNDVMGGGHNGLPDNAALLKVLRINDTVVQGIEKAIKSSLTVRGVMRINTMLDGDKIDAERDRFEKAIDDNTSGIIAMDLKSEYVDIKTNPKLIDQSTLEFLERKILPWFNMPVPIFTGDFNDEQKEAWYDGALEVILIGLGQSFTKTIFSATELSHGNKIIFYQRELMYMSAKTKNEFLKIVGEQGLLTDDQKLAVLGYPPLADGTGNRRTISLNYISTEIADEYQMKKAGTKKTEED